jgi:hypothetical protein
MKGKEGGEDLQQCVSVLALMWRAQAVYCTLQHPALCHETIEQSAAVTPPPPPPGGACCEKADFYPPLCTWDCKEMGQSVGNCTSCSFRDLAWRSRAPPTRQPEAQPQSVGWPATIYSPTTAAKGSCSGRNCFIGWCCCRVIQCWSYSAGHTVLVLLLGCTTS